MIQYLGRPSVGRWENLVWRSGLYDWCRGCMQMRGAISVLVRGTVKSSKWRLMFIKAQYQPTALQHFAWSLITRVLLWSPLEGPLCRWPCYHRWRNVSGGSWLGKKQWKRKDRVNAGKMKIMICGTGLDLLQSSGKFPCTVFHTGVGSNNIFCNVCTHWVHKKCSGLKRLTKDPDYRLQTYMVPGNCMSLERQTTEGSPGRTWQARVCCFLLLPRRHALSSRWLWTFNHNMCENCLEDVAMCTALVCIVQCFMPVRLGHWQSQTSSICSRMTGQWSDRSAMSGHKTLSLPGPMSYLRDLALRIWTSFWRREGSAGMDMWNALMVQSRQPFTYRLRKVWSWEAQDDIEAANRQELQRLEALGY